MITILKHTQYYSIIYEYIKFFLIQYPLKVARSPIIYIMTPTI